MYQTNCLFPTPHALPPVTELNQLYKSRNYTTRPPTCYRIVPTITLLYLHHTHSHLLQNCTNYNSPVPTPHALPPVTDLYQLYQSCTYTTRTPTCYRTVPTITVLYLHFLPSLLLQNCTNYTSPVPTPLANPPVTELYQLYQSPTYTTPPPSC